MTSAPGPVPTACVLGDLDLVAPLLMAGVNCAVVAPPGDPARYSRRVEVVGWADPWSAPEALVEVLLRYARTQQVPPVLFYQTDPYALVVSRHRGELAAAYRFAIPEHELLEQLVDKLRFRSLAQRLGLPVPASSVLDPNDGDPARSSLAFPVLVKPGTRGDARWAGVEPDRKAIRVASVAELVRVWPRLIEFGDKVLVQELVPGPETAIESYHAYSNARHQVIAEFTGQKVRTRPVEYGHTTALTITAAADVAGLGRQITSRLGVHGVVKLDFKRAPDGALLLLEVNPRFNLWHHPGAIAGVNIPALVWADVSGQPTPRQRPVARPGVSWCSPWDLQAALEWGTPLSAWLPWAWRCEAKSMMSPTDPLPFLRLCVQRAQRGWRRIRPGTGGCRRH